MSANGISTLTTKQAKQLAKLDIAQAKRQGKTVAVDGTTTGNIDPSQPYFRQNNIYDINLLPTKYSGNNIVDNANPDGLQLGRPWIPVVESAPTLLIDLGASNDASYPGSGTAWNDISGYTRNATLYNSPAYTATEPGYLTFVPSSLQYADIPNIGDLASWSVETWFRIDAPLSSAQATAVVTTVYDGTGQINFVIGTNPFVGNSNTLAVGFFNGSWHTCTPITPTVGVWYHVVGTYDGTTLKQYVNGALNTSAAATGPSSANGGAIRIARRWDDAAASQHYFPGDVNTVRIYDGVLTAAQVQTNYSAQAADFGY
jgi:hypothetical protein